MSSEKEIFEERTFVIWGGKMPDICVKAFLFLLIFAIIRAAPAYAYSYEDYMPPGTLPPDSVPARTYPSQAAATATSTLSQDIHAPVSRAGMAPALPVQTGPSANNADQNYSVQDAEDTDKVAEESHRQGGDWYVSASVGALQRSAATAAGTGSFGPATAQVNFQAGPTVTLAAGYRVLPYFRVEGELDYSDYDIKDVRPDDPRFPGNGSTYKSISSINPIYRGAFLLNGYLDLPGYGPLVPYIGGGLGVARLFGTTNVSRNYAGNELFTNLGRYTTGVAMLEAGVDVILSDHWSVAPSYRYLHYFADDDALGDETASVFKMIARYSF